MTASISDRLSNSRCEPSWNKTMPSSWPFLSIAIYLSICLRFEIMTSTRSISNQLMVLEWCPFLYPLCHAHLWDCVFPHAADSYNAGAVQNEKGQASKQQILMMEAYCKQVQLKSCFCLSLLFTALSLRGRIWNLNREYLQAANGPIQINLTFWWILTKSSFVRSASLFFVIMPEVVQKRWDKKFLASCYRGWWWLRVIAAQYYVHMVRKVKCVLWNKRRTPMEWDLYYIEAKDESTSYSDHFQLIWVL